MSSIRAMARRLPFVSSRHVAADMAEVRAVTLHVQQVVESMNHTVVELASLVERLNHDVRSGADESLPLFLGYAERLRLDADTSVAAAQLIEREIAALRTVVAGLRADLDRE